MATKKKLEPATQKEDSKAEVLAKNDEAAEAKATAKKASSSTRRSRVRKNLDPNMFVIVRNGFHGPLYYRDTNTSEEHFWPEFGDEADMTLSTLMNARGSQRRFFSDNWWLIDDPDVIDYLGVGRYYKNALTYDDFYEIFDLPYDEIREKLEGLSDGQKRSVAFMAKEQIESGELSDLNVVKMLEDVLHTELIAGR